MLDELREDGGTALPLRAIRILDYLNEDGAECTTWAVEGEPAVRHMLAMLEISRLQIGARVVEQQLGDD